MRPDARFKAGGAEVRQECGSCSAMHTEHLRAHSAVGQRRYDTDVELPGRITGMTFTREDAEWTRGVGPQQTMYSTKGAFGHGAAPHHVHDRVCVPSCCHRSQAERCQSYPSNGNHSCILALRLPRGDRLGNRRLLEAPGSHLAIVQLIACTHSY